MHRLFARACKFFRFAVSRNDRIDILRLMVDSLVGKCSIGGSILQGRRGHSNAVLEFKRLFIFKPEFFDESLRLGDADCFQSTNGRNVSRLNQGIAHRHRAFFFMIEVV